MESKISRPKNRKRNSLNLDLERFEEIKLREKELQADIPPNRIQKYLSQPELKSCSITKDSSRFSNQYEKEGNQIIVKEEEQNDPIIRKTRKSTRVAAHSKNVKVERSMIKKPAPRRLNEKFKEVSRFFTRNKPKYFYPNSIKNPSWVKENPKAESGHLTFPPKLADTQRSTTSFEDKIILSHSYQELIDKVREGLKDSSIDVALSNQLVPKNLEYEKNRFSLLPGSAHKAEDFSTFDLDLFLQRLSQDTSVLARRASLV
ncbi:hypothetical protein CLIB1423_33S00276 [[Candida] railenensis]|uniref:Uncharacterized protein n=1 Tax=[Candida] railenensis TaxID=45579 RepID=A0A9P0QU94_9ASCO|nr:hypothetical protein CLIB1423_33S00276 [[Candida] railenensis]